jgi:hypothetical protein
MVALDENRRAVVEYKYDAYSNREVLRYSIKTLLRRVADYHIIWNGDLFYGGLFKGNRQRFNDRRT